MVRSLQSFTAARTEKQVSRLSLKVSAKHGHTDDAAGWLSMFQTTTDTTQPSTLLVWNPTASGGHNLYRAQVATGQGLPVSSIFMDQTTFQASWHCVSTPMVPDVRAAYPGSAVRVTGATCVLDVDMGGGTAKLRVAPLTPHLMGSTIESVVEMLSSDIHTVDTIDLGRNGKGSTRLQLSPWTQSRKALGEWTTAGAIRSLIGDVDTAPPGSSADVTTDKQGSYSDNHPFGGYVMIIDEVYTAVQGSQPNITVVSTVDIQVQLPPSLTHLKMEHDLSLKAFMDKYQHAQPEKPTTGKSGNSATDQAMKGKAKAKPNARRPTKRPPPPPPPRPTKPPPARIYDTGVAPHASPRGQRSNAGGGASHSALRDASDAILSLLGHAAGPRQISLTQGELRRLKGRPQAPRGAPPRRLS